MPKSGDREVEMTFVSDFMCENFALTYVCFVTAALGISGGIKEALFLLGVPVFILAVLYCLLRFAGVVLRWIKTER